MKSSARAQCIAIPVNDEAANALLVEYGAAFNTLVRQKADMDDALAKVKETYEEAAKPFQERLSTLFAQLAAYGAEHRKRLTEDGKSKTVQLPAGEIGWRRRPASVRLKRGAKLEDILVELKRLGLRRFIRRTEELNKDRMLDEPDVAAEVEGIVVGSAGEKFYVAPFGAELSEPK